jgi:hypothetical protein
VAAATGFSTETIARIERRARDLAHRVEAPASLVAAAELLAGEILDPGEAAARLHTAGLTRQVLHPTTVLQAANWFGLPAQAVVFRLPNGSGLVVPIRDLPTVNTALPAVRAACRDRGITTLPDLLHIVTLDRDVLVRLIDADPALRRLESEVWLIRDRGRNVVRATLRRSWPSAPTPSTTCSPESKPECTGARSTRSCPAGRRWVPTCTTSRNMSCADIWCGDGEVSRRSRPARTRRSSPRSAAPGNGGSPPRSCAGR